ncbi:Ig-like domain-containing protein [Streptomyces sp. HPF1205]|uniref:L,D-transpeptidase n=1 Tax=Streptomyces sp. HPF1205 TaxID=2873262 RepID=UPI0035ABB3B0
MAVLIGGTVALAACGMGGKGHADAAAPTGATHPAAATGVPSALKKAQPQPQAQTAQAAQAQVQADAAAAQNASTARITITPASGSTNASVNGMKVAVTGGVLTSVTMTSAGGAAVAGTMSADHLTWTPKAALAGGTQYTVTASASDGQGRVTTANDTFATASVSHSFIGYFTPENGSKVGVGMPVSINFDKAITHKADVQRHISVTSSSGQQVVGHWFGSKRLDLRPQTYWKAGSHVSLTLHLRGVEGARGVYGVQDKTVGFDVGRSQVSTVDTSTHKMTVVRDGKVIKTIPISAGGPDHTTYNGQMVISEKDPTTRMNGSTVGLVKDGKSEYDIPDVPHAMRLTTSGTFIHGNYWAAPSAFGHDNTSHGCIGLEDLKGSKDPTTPAAWFYNNSMVGDVVVVKSAGRTVPADNGLNGWNLSWAQWLAGSAI